MQVKFSDIKKYPIKNITHSLIKLIIGIVAVAGSVAVTEFAGRPLLDKIQIDGDIQNLIIAIADVAVGLLSYILLFRYYEKRQISELSVQSLAKNALIAFLCGFILQSLFILVIYLNNGYTITHINSLSFFLPAFTNSLTAGFIAELIIIGIVFRIIEEISGTLVALMIVMLLFAILHSGSKEATFLSVISTVMQAGFLLPATYVFTRSLWAPVFLHFAWDFTEPGIYGAINPGNNLTQSLFTAKITGTQLLTGGPSGPQNSIQACLFCMVAALLLLWSAKQKNRFITISKN